MDPIQSLALKEHRNPQKQKSTPALSIVRAGPHSPEASALKLASQIRSTAGWCGGGHNRKKRIFSAMNQSTLGGRKAQPRQDHVPVDAWPAAWKKWKFLIRSTLFEQPFPSHFFGGKTSSVPINEKSNKKIREIEALTHIDKRAKEYLMNYLVPVPLHTRVSHRQEESHGKVAGVWAASSHDAHL